MLWFVDEPLGFEEFIGVYRGVGGRGLVLVDHFFRQDLRYGDDGRFGSGHLVAAPHPAVMPGHPVVSATAVAEATTRAVVAVVDIT